MRGTLLSFYIALFLFPFFNVLAQESNAGIVQGLWYGTEKFFAGENARMYIAIRNNTGSDLTGTVDFYDNEKKLDRKQVQALNGRIIESWADWTPTYGTHTVSAILSRIELTAIGTSTQEIEVVSALAKDTIFVDNDTDKDGIGNIEDADDDNDEISDLQEKLNATNPLVPDAPVPKETAQDIRSENIQSALITSTETNSTPAGPNPDSSNSLHESSGIEQYLAPSRAESILSDVTDYITTTKQSLDTYREKRSQDIAIAKATTSLPLVNADGFGVIGRTSEDAQSNFSLPTLDGAGFFGKLFGGIGKLITTLYTFILTVVSYILGHPIFVQLGLLLLILFILIKLASKFGRRPTQYRKHT